MFQGRKARIGVAIMFVAAGLQPTAQLTNPSQASDAMINYTHPSPPTAGSSLLTTRAVHNPWHC